MTEEKSNIEEQVNNTEAMETDQKEEDQPAKDEVDKEKSPEPKDEKTNSSGTPSKKSKVTEDEDEDEDEEGDEESEEEEQKVGLFDQPLEVSGSRERKKVQRLDVSFSSTSEKQPEIAEGKGEKLGDCPRIEFQIQKTHSDELKPLHKILYKRLGSGIEIKRNIRKFSGFPFEKDSSEYQKKKTLLEKLTNSVLKHMCEMLDVERGGNKEEIVVRLLDFLVKPVASGKNVPKKRGTKGAKRKSKAKKSVNSSTAAEASDEDDEKDEEDTEQKNGSNESEGDEEEVEEPVVKSEEEEEEEEPKKKKRGPKKKAAEKKAPAKRKSSTQRKPRNSKKSKMEVKSEEEEEDDDDDEDEPVVKKSKKPPTDDDIVGLIKKILDGANLEEITMKKVIKEVFEKFPDHDLGEKKEFIKTTVRSLIS